VAYLGHESRIELPDFLLGILAEALSFTSIPVAPSRQAPASSDDGDAISARGSLR
jgi:hypothetical protein